MITAEQLLIEAAELKKKKSQDYQGSTWKEVDYFPYKEKSYAHMLHTKYLRMRNIFTKHPNSVGETYLQHLVKGLSFSIKLIFISLKAFIHAIVPCLFEHSTSDRVAELHNFLQKRKNSINSDEN